MASTSSAPTNRGSQWLSAIAVMLALLASLIAIQMVQYQEIPIRSQGSGWQALQKADDQAHGGTPLITRLTMVSVNRSEPLLNLVDWGVLDFAELPPVKILIQSTQETVKCVQVWLDGTLLAVRNEFPMFVTGMPLLNLPNGIHWISVIPFSQLHGAGIRGPERKVSFIVLKGRDSSFVQGLAIFPDTLSSMLLPANDSGASQITDLQISNLQPDIPMRISSFPKPGLGFQVFIDSIAVSPAVNDFPFDFVLKELDLGLHSIVVIPSIPFNGSLSHSTFFLNVVKSPFFPAIDLYPEVTKFLLYNTDWSEDVSDFIISDGFVMNSVEVYKRVSNPTIRVDTSPENVGSVRFQLDGSTIAISNVFPYRIGDTIFKLAPGTYNLSATAFSDQDARGIAGPTRYTTLTFQ